MIQNLLQTKWKKKINISQKGLHYNKFIDSIMILIEKINV